MPSGVIGTLEKTSADPAAAAEISWTADEDCIVHSIYFALATDGTGTPQVSVVADDGTDIFFAVMADAAQAVSQTEEYCAFDGSEQKPLEGGAGGLWQLAWPSTGLRLRKGDRLRTVTISLAGTDNFTAMTLNAEHF